jgi:hypothetical protein
MFRRSALPGPGRSIGRVARALQLTALCAAVHGFAIRPSLALDCSAIVVDRGDVLSFGQARLGDPRSRLPPDAAGPRTCEQSCEYTDGAGVTYGVKGDEIVRKEIADVTRYRGALPARISAADSLQTILMRLAAFSEGTPIWSLTPVAGGGLQLHTDNCIEGGNGVRGSYGFTFDRDGRLTTISAEIL